MSRRTWARCFVGLLMGVLSGGVFAEDGSPDLYIDHFIEVDPANVEKFEAAVAEKTKKFNRREGAAVWNTHKILTGPRAGSYVRWCGPLTWKDLDRKDTTNALYNPKHEEVIYWREKVIPLVKKRLTTEVWDADLDSYYQGLPPNKMPRYISVVRWKMKPGMYQRKAALDARLGQAFRKAGFKANIIVSRLHSGGDKMTFATTVLFNTMEDYGKTQRWDGIGGIYDSIHGAGSWKKHLEEHNAVMQEGAVVETEIWQFMPELSSLQAKSPGK